MTVCIQCMSVFTFWDVLNILPMMSLLLQVITPFSYKKYLSLQNSSLQGVLLFILSIPALTSHSSTILPDLTKLRVPLSYQVTLLRHNLLYPFAVNWY